MRKGKAMSYSLNDELIQRIADVGKFYGTSRSHVLRAIVQEQLPRWEKPGLEGYPERIAAVSYTHLRAHET